MHLSDGILPVEIIAGGWIVSAMLAGVAVKKLAPEDLPKVAVTTSAFFVASIIHIPVGPSSVHLLLPGLVGVLLGRSAFLAILLGLIMQCFFFQFGGITVLGVNAIIMGVPALIAGTLFQWFSKKSHALAGGVAGGSAILLAGLLLSSFLALSGSDFLGVAKINLVLHIPVACIEAIISCFTVSFLLKVKPELLRCRETVPAASFSG